jgi:hypothetical protein
MLGGFGGLGEIVDDKRVDAGVALAKPRLGSQPIEIAPIVGERLYRLTFVFAEWHDFTVTQ